MQKDKEERSKTPHNRRSTLRMRKRNTDKDKDKDRDRDKDDHHQNADKDKAVQSFFDKPTPEQKESYEKFVKGVLEKGVTNLVKEFMDNVKPYVNPHLKKDSHVQHHNRNRYNDVICHDGSRVVLDDGKGGDYIHANHVRSDALYNEFICTQGPMPTSVTDFWRMIVNYKIHHIVMLCLTMENNKSKCEQYWPLTQGEKKSYGHVSVTHVSSKNADSHTVRTILEVEAGSYKAFVRHHHWKTWPDRLVPQSNKPLMRILRNVRRSPRPVVVHCSAGIGRTGTLVAVEMCLQKIFHSHSHSLNMVEQCRILRDQRMNAVQVDIQYVYIALVLLEYGKAMNYYNPAPLQADIEKFRADFEALVKLRAEQDRVRVPVGIKTERREKSCGADHKEKHKDKERHKCDRELHTPEKEYAERKEKEKPKDKERDKERDKAPHTPRREDKDSKEHCKKDERCREERRKEGSPHKPDCNLVTVCEGKSSTMTSSPHTAHSSPYHCSTTDKATSPVSNAAVTASASPVATSPGVNNNTDHKDDNKDNNNDHIHTCSHNNNKENHASDHYEKQGEKPAVTQASATVNVPASPPTATSPSTASCPPHSNSPPAKHQDPKQSELVSCRVTVMDNQQTNDNRTSYDSCCPARPVDSCPALRQSNVSSMTVDNSMPITRLADNHQPRLSDGSPTPPSTVVTTPVTTALSPQSPPVPKVLNDMPDKDKKQKTHTPSMYL